MHALSRWMKFAALLISCVFVLTACGGGGGSDDVDRTPPALSPETDSVLTQQSTQTISGTIENGAQLEVSVDTAAQAEMTFPTATTWVCTISGLEEGVNTFTFTATDGAGNTIVKKVTITRDTTAPKVTLDQVSSPSNKTSQTLAGTIESGASLEITTDSAVTIATPKINGSAWDCLISGMTDGEFTFIITAVDAAGNDTSVEKTIVIDITAPTLGISAVTTPTNSSSQIIKGTVEGDAGVAVSVDTSAVVGVVTYPTDTTWQCVISELAEGANRISVSAEDAVGNTATSTAMIIADYIAPEITAIVPADAEYDVAVDSVITVTFGEDIDESTLTSACFFLDDSFNNTIPGTVDYDSANKLIRFTPDSEFDVGATYYATVTTDIVDLAGNPLASDFSWSFDTITYVEPPSSPF